MGNGARIASLHARAEARGIVVESRVFANALASLEAGKHLLMFGGNAQICEATAELIADEAADVGRSYGTVVLSGETASLLPVSRILTEEYVQDFWVVLRRTTAIALGRLLDELHQRPGANQRLLAVAAGAPRLALDSLSPRARRQIALVDVSGS
jgi:hypothetical protein